MNSERIITLLKIVREELELQEYSVHKLRFDAMKMRDDPEQKDKVIGMLLAAIDVAGFDREAAEAALNRAIVALREEQDDA